MRPVERVIRPPKSISKENSNQYVIKTELPGFNKDEVNIEVDKDTLAFKAEKKSEEEEKSENYLHRERYYTSAERMVNFPEEIDPSKVEGKMENGYYSSNYPRKNQNPKKKRSRFKLNNNNFFKILI